MEKIFNYYIWHPRLQAANLLVFNITPGEQSHMPGHSRTFFNDLLRTLKISCELMSWKVFAYRSSYQGEPDASDWRDRWPVNWRIIIELTVPLGSLSPLRHEYIGTFAFDAEGLAEKSSVHYECIVISDYENANKADDAKRAIVSSKKVTDLARRKKAAPPVFKRIVLNETLVQEQVSLGTFPESFFRSGARYMVAVEDVCRSFGGITNFDERAARRKELFNPDGLE